MLLEPLSGACRDGRAFRERHITDIVQRVLDKLLRFAHGKFRSKSIRDTVLLFALPFGFVEQVTRNVAPLDGQRFTFGAQTSPRLESSPNKMKNSRKSFSELACSFLRTIVSEGLNICSNPLKPVWKLATLFQLQDDCNLRIAKDNKLSSSLHS